MPEDHAGLGLLVTPTQTLGWLYKEPLTQFSSTVRIQRKGRGGGGLLFSVWGMGCDIPLVLEFEQQNGNG